MNDTKDQPQWQAPGLEVPSEKRAERRPTMVTTRWEIGAGTAADATGELSGRIAKYMSQLPNLGEAQGRDDVGYRFACFLVRDLQIPDDDALMWLRTWDSNNNPAKGEECCKKWIASAHTYGSREYGCGLVGRTRLTTRRVHPRPQIVRCVVEVP
jgi:hypothetical protein